MTRIAVLNTAFLGDAILTLPLIQSLRLRYPGASIDYYVRGGLESLFEPHPDIAAVRGFDKRGRERGLAGLARQARGVAGRGYDLWLSAHASPRSGVLALASKARLRIGYGESFASRLVYNRIVQRRFGEREEIERLLALLEPLGPGPVSAWPELALGEREAQQAGNFFAARRGPVLGLHPGSVWATKRWLPEAFAAVGGRAIEAGAEVALLAGPGEQAVAEQVKSAILADIGQDGAERLHDFSGRLSLPLLAAVISGLSCYLTNDSGPMHIAWCRRVPVTAVFGPTVRALGFYPRGERSTVFETALDCRPCNLHGPARCPQGHHLCMRRIDPEAVWRDVRQKLFGPAADGDGAPR